MYIKSLSFQDQARKWRLEEISFKKLTLLVGASGVGKTRILDSILKLRDISGGKSFNGLKWKTVFETHDNQTCVWEGEFETRPVGLGEMLGDAIQVPIGEREETNPPKIVCESLRLNDEEIINRNEKAIRLRNKETPQLARDESAIHLLKEEPDVSPAFRGFQRILDHDEELILRSWFSRPSLQARVDRCKGIEDIRESGGGLKTAIYLASVKARDVFEAIKDTFIDVFPFVEDLRVEIVQDERTMPFVIPVAQVKERGVDEWISEPALSSGMRRTLSHIAELHLYARGTVILVDEFENGLGVNCIDAVTDQLLSPERELQFIVTSHHPYIINNIPSSYWKLVTRRGGVVRALDAAELNLPVSKHDAFTQLINLDAYTEGPET